MTHTCAPVPVREADAPCSVHYRCGASWRHLVRAGEHALVPVTETTWDERVYCEAEDSREFVRAARVCCEIRAPTFEAALWDLTIHAGMEPYWPTCDVCLRPARGAWAHVEDGPLLCVGCSWRSKALRRHLARVARRGRRVRARAVNRARRERARRRRELPSEYRIHVTLLSELLKTRVAMSVD